MEPGFGSVATTRVTPRRSSASEMSAVAPPPSEMIVGILFPRPNRSSTRSRSADQPSPLIAFVHSRGSTTDVSRLTRLHAARPRGVILKEVGSKRGAKTIDTHIVGHSRTHPHPQSV